MIHDLNLTAILVSRVAATTKAGRIIAVGRPEEVIRDDIMGDVFDAGGTAAGIALKAPMPFVLP